MKAEASEWLSFAESDLDTARYLLDGGRLAASAFHAQQAAEKAFKALLVETRGAFPKIHDLVALGQDVKVPAPLLEACARLSSVYVATRYPDATVTLTPPVVQALLRTAEEVIAWVRRQM